MKILDRLHKHNIFLIIVAALLALILVLKFQTSAITQFIILSMMVIFYLIWAINYHLNDKTLKLEIMIEYFLIAALALIFFYGILL